MDKKQILFVCLGNICRSPAAEGILQSMVDKNGLSDAVFIDSAGTYGGHAGDLPDKRMRLAADKRGYKLTSRSRKITPTDIETFDMIIVMDDQNYENVSRLASKKEYLTKIHRLTDFCTKHNNKFVPDPYSGGPSGFEFALDLLEDGCEGILNQISCKDNNKL